MVDDFFGVRTHDSRHSAPVVRTSVVSNSDLPPAYTFPSSSQYAEDSDELPTYSPTPTTAPTTLASYLFTFGFLFPPFWVLGALILLSPLSPPEGWEHEEKSEEEKAVLVRIVRDAECRWAWRCVWALLGLALVVAVVIGVVLGIRK